MLTFDSTLASTTCVCIQGEIQFKVNTKDVLDFKLRASPSISTKWWPTVLNKLPRCRSGSLAGVLTLAAFVFPQGANILLTDNGYVKLGERSRWQFIFSHILLHKAKNATFSHSAGVFLWHHHFVLFFFPPSLCPLAFLTFSVAVPSLSCCLTVADFGVSAQITATLAKRKSFIGTPYWLVLFATWDFPVNLWTCSADGVCQQEEASLSLSATADISRGTLSVIQNQFV